LNCRSRLVRLARYIQVRVSVGCFIRVSVNDNVEDDGDSGGRENRDNGNRAHGNARFPRTSLGSLSQHLASLVRAIDHDVLLYCFLIRIHKFLLTVIN